MKISATPPLTRVETILQNIVSAIETGRLPPGTRLPSIRRQALASGVSPFTVVEVYDRLAAQGYVQSRRGSGVFVLARERSEAKPKVILEELPVDEHWLLHNVYNLPGKYLPVGCGWLPGDWYDTTAQHRALRTLARDASISSEYGDPQGFLALRHHLARQLTEQDITVDASNIVLTQGASSALNIVAASVARPGDTVFVDDPGYCNLLSSLTFQGFNVVGVPWSELGPDTKVLTDLLLQYRPRVFFTNPWLQNPTGASYNTHTAHQVLKLAEQYDFLLVEDNVSADLANARQTTLAALDGLSRVIYIGSFSKSVSPALRVGFIAAQSTWIEKLVRYKMMSGLTTPEINERITLEILQESRFRKQMDKLRDRLAQAQFNAAQRFDGLGWELFTRPQNGLFILAKPPGKPDSLAMAQQARQSGILLAPGKLFRPYGQEASWLRFNVAYCQDPALWRFLETIR